MFPYEFGFIFLYVAAFGFSDYFVKIMKLNGMRSQMFKRKPKISRGNFKFPPFEMEKILFKIDKLIKILKIEQKLNCEFLSDRTLLIKKK